MNWSKLPVKKMNKALSMHVFVSCTKVLWFFFTPALFLTHLKLFGGACFFSSIFTNF